MACMLAQQCFIRAVSWESESDELSDAMDGAVCVLLLPLLEEDDDNEVLVLEVSLELLESLLESEELLEL